MTFGKILIHCLEKFLKIFKELFSKSSLNRVWDSVPIGVGGCQPLFAIGRFVRNGCILCGFRPNMFNGT